MNDSQITDSIDLGHTSIAYQRRGSGPDLVFIHGWPLDHRTWDPIVADLPGFTCHTFDLPGAGASTPTANSPTAMPEMARAVGEVIDQVGLTSYGLVGHDSGGLIARLVAAERADDVTSLVLAGTEIPGHHAWQIAMFKLVLAIPGSNGVFKTFLSTPVLANSPLAIGGLFSNLERIRPGFAEMMGDLLSDDAIFESQMNVLRAFDSDVIDSLADVHPKLAMPTLCIWGEDDGFFPVAKAREMTEQFGGDVRFEVIDDARLFVHEEHPARFAELMGSFLSTVAA